MSDEKWKLFITLSNNYNNIIICWNIELIHVNLIIYFQRL